MKWMIGIILMSFSLLVSAQIGGDQVYEFVNLSNSARITALGGNLITVSDDDVNLAYANPANLNEKMHRQLTVNSQFLFSGTGIWTGYVGYGHHWEAKDLTFHAGLQFVDYGTFQGTDEAGVFTNEFEAAEYALVLGVSKQLSERLWVGANFKNIFSNLESYASYGMGLDLAANYKNETSKLQLSLVVKNIGAQISTYEAERSPIPFEAQIGLSKQLDRLPFRFSIIYHHLNRWNILYDDPNSEEDILIIGGNNQGRTNAQIWLDNFFRHFIFNGEFLFGKNENMRLRLGYNVQRRGELSIDGVRSLAGFSFGAGFKVKRFRIDYGRSYYHIAGATNHIGISTSLNSFK